MKLQKIIIIIALCILPLAPSKGGRLLSQDFGFDEWEWWSKGHIIWYPQVACADLDLTTIPVVAYDDFCLQFTPPQFIKFLHKTHLDISSGDTNIYIRWDMKQTSFTGVSYIFSQSHPSVSFPKNLALVSYQDSLKLVIKDTTFGMYKQNSSANWHTYIFWIHNVSSQITLELYVDGDNVYSHPTTLPDFDTTFALTAFVWGAQAQWNTTDIGQVSGNTIGTFTGYLDNIYVVSDDSVLINTKFNDGGTQQPADSSNWAHWERSYGPHEEEQPTLLNGCGFGGSWVAQDYWDPVWSRRSGTRKDTNKYFQAITGYNGLRLWSAYYIRAAVNKAAVNPNDSTEVAVTGYFNCYGDSSITTPQYIALIKDGVVDNTGKLGSGLQIASPEFGWWVTWYRDSLLIAVHSGDSAGGVYAPRIAMCNTNTGVWSAMGNLSSIIPAKCVLFKDSLWILNGSILRAWDGSAWVGKDTFDLTGGKVFTSICTMGNDTLCMFLDADGMYKRVGGSHTLMFASHPYIVPPAEGRGGVYYSSDYWKSSNKRLYLSGDFDSLGGVAAKNVCYYSSLDGKIHNIGTGFGGYSIARDGWFTCVATAITEWLGKIIFAGSIRIANGVYIGSNLAMYDELTTEWCAFDYGIDWRPQGMTVFNSNGYKELMIVGDGTAAGGMSANHIAGRYSPEHFAVLNPNITLTALPDIPEADYPPTITIDCESPAGRSVSAALKYKIGINGDTLSSAFSKIDSSLTTVKGYWQFTRQAVFGDTAVGGDSVYYWVEAIDNLSNDSVSSTDYFKIFAVSVDLDSLKYYAEFSEDLGFGISTITNNKIPSLYVDGTRNGDTLEVSGAVDSISAAGYLYFDGVNDYLTFTTNFYLHTSYTIIIWFQSLSGDNGIIMGKAAGGSDFFLYTTTASSMDNTDMGGGFFDYYVNWGSQNDADTVTVWQSTNDLFRNGILRDDNNSILTSSKSEKFKFFQRGSNNLPLKGRLKRIAIINKLITPTQILDWNPQ